MSVARRGPPLEEDRTPPPARKDLTCPSFLRASRAACLRTGSEASPPPSQCSCCSRSRPAPPRAPATTSRSPGPSRRRRSTSSRRTRRRSAAPTRRSSSPSTRARSPTPSHGRQSTRRLVEVRELEGVELAASPFEAGGQISEDERLAAVDVRYSTDPGDLKKDDGEALIAAAETAEPAVQVEARGTVDRPRRRAGGARRRDRRRAHRDRAAHAAVPVRCSDGRHADRRSRRCGGGADPPRGGVGARSACRPSPHSSP